MKPGHDSSPLLRRLHERVFAAPEVRAVLDAGFAQLAAELRSRPEPLHAACVMPIGLFTAALPAGEARQIRLCRLFLLRRGARMAVPERHRNSVQRLVSYWGKGRIHQGMPGGGPEELRPRAIFSPTTNTAAGDDRPGAGTAASVDDPTAAPVDLGCHWDIVPAGVWHFPEAAEDGDWATVTFHSAAENEIVDELWHDGMHRWPSAASRPGPAGPPSASAARAANKCFVCGPDNPIGLHLDFRLEDGACVSEFTPGENHQGYPDVIHGGMIYSALDDVMANWLYLRGARAYTARCEIRYRRPAREGETLLLVGRQTARKRKVAKMEGTATRASDGKVVAAATATFVVVDEGPVP